MPAELAARDEQSGRRSSGCARAWARRRSQSAPAQSWDAIVDRLVEAAYQERRRSFAPSRRPPDCHRWCRHRAIRARSGHGQPGVSSRRSAEHVYGWKEICERSGRSTFLRNIRRLRLAWAAKHRRSRCRLALSRAWHSRRRLQNGGAAAEARTRWLCHRRQLLVDDTPLTGVRARAAPERRAIGCRRLHAPWVYPIAKSVLKTSSSSTTHTTSNTDCARACCRQALPDAVSPPTLSMSKANWRAGQVTSGCVRGKTRTRWPRHTGSPATIFILCPIAPTQVFCVPRATPCVSGGKESSRMAGSSCCRVCR